MVAFETARHHRTVPPRRTTNPYLTALGKRVRQFRANKGWSQEQLEEKAGVERVYLSRIERGQQNPSILTVRALAKAFDISVQKLLPPEQKPKKPTDEA